MKNNGLDSLDYYPGSAPDELCEQQPRIICLTSLSLFSPLIRVTNVTLSRLNELTHRAISRK